MFSNSGGLSAAMPEVCVINWRIVIGTPVGFAWPLTWTRENSGKNLASGSSSRSFRSSTRSSAPKSTIDLLIGQCRRRICALWPLSIEVLVSRSFECQHLISLDYHHHDAYGRSVAHTEVHLCPEALF